MNTGTYKPYGKPNDETLYAHAKSNHPANILKQLPISIETRLSNLSSNSEIFHEASKHYQNILNQYGNMGMTTNFNTNQQIMKMKTKVNRPKVAKEISSGSTHLFQRTSPTTSVNISFF